MIYATRLAYLAYTPAESRSVEDQSSTSPYQASLSSLSLYSNLLQPPTMFPVSLKSFSTGLAVVLLSTAVLSQERNLSFPTTTSSPATNPVQTSLPAGNNNNPTNSSTTPTTNGATTTNNNNNNNSTQATNSNNSTIHSNTTAPVKLTPIPDSTGSAGSVPFPASTGGKPNGRYGPDDQYIASSVVKIIAPTLPTLIIMSSTVAILSYGALL
ncbi:hypothetical protein PGT21_018459 [Puccinia graminis f. sp. tritici]|uniref:Uncharacterized protein n=1 Tax=Puccinia graminis f. sp. tritici TaxID=56615 RepID=A0A5B0QAX2_PUCGR|nr:hypothetical protein PGT21_018459 [Puccinia graminis f. sp. tritici]